MSADSAAAPIVAVDVAVFTVLDGALHVLLAMPRGGAFAGKWALPGGRVRPDESLDEAARRELAAQTGITSVYLEQLYTSGGCCGTGRRVVSVRTSRSSRTAAASQDGEKREVSPHSPGAARRGSRRSP